MRLLDLNDFQASFASFCTLPARASAVVSLVNNRCNLIGSDIRAS